LRSFKPKAKAFSRKFLFEFFEEEYSGLCAGNKISNLVAKETNCHMPKVFKVIYAKVHFIRKNKNYNIWLLGANKVRDKSIQNRFKYFKLKRLQKYKFYCISINLHILPSQ